MEYGISFLEGIRICGSSGVVLLLLICALYFGGSARRENAESLKIGFCFLAGFTAVFLTLTAAAGYLAGVPETWGRIADGFCGILLMLFGLSCAQIPLGKKLTAAMGRLETPAGSGAAAALLGMALCALWTTHLPFLAEFAPMGGVRKGMIMLVCFALGMGVPFLLVAVVTDYLKSRIKTVGLARRICAGGLLISGFAAAAGFLGRWITMTN